MLCYAGSRMQYIELYKSYRVKTTKAKDADCFSIINASLWGCENRKLRVDISPGKLNRPKKFHMPLRNNLCSQQTHTHYDYSLLHLRPNVCSPCLISTYIRWKNWLQTAQVIQIKFHFKTNLKRESSQLRAKVDRTRKPLHARFFCS